MRWVFVLLVLPLVACGSGESEPAPVPPPTTTTLARTPEDCSELAVTALEVQTGIAGVVGTHAELMPKGQYVRVRVALVNTGRRVHDTQSQDYELLDTAAAVYPMNIDAMRVKRQLWDLQIGAGNRLEMDLWYDLPLGAIPQNLRDTVCASAI
ncbi:hypothetical protein, partial [Streptomyces roseolus]|uniref:hypothetical protein n=1 Tax=Streptomyces roseolus TaxID=67358 RepID=UPI00365AB9E6